MLSLYNAEVRTMCFTLHIMKSKKTSAYSTHGTLLKWRPYTGHNALLKISLSIDRPGMFGFIGCQACLVFILAG